jgi:hypothetical protein
VALAEGDEHPDQLALRVAGDLEDESEGALRGGRVDEGQIELRAFAQPASSVPSGPSPSQGRRSASATPRCSVCARALVAI